VRIGWLLVALWCAVAVIVVVVNSPEHLSRKRAEQTPTRRRPRVPSQLLAWPDE